MSLSADQIRQAQDLPVRREPVPEWGGEVLIRTVPGAEKDAFEAALSKMSDAERMHNWRSRLVALCLVDEGGKRLFSDDQVEQLGCKNGVVLDRLYDLAAGMNGMSVKSVKDAEKNSEPARSDASTSA